jgi:type II secretion system protein N
MDNATTPDALPIDAASPPPSRGRKILRIAGWIGFALACLAAFTFLKLPEVRLKNYIQGMLAHELGGRGITYTAGRTSISMFLGVSYKMRDVTLNFPPPAAPVHIDQIEVSPSILSMALGRMGGKLWIHDGDGSLKASFSARQTKTALEASASFKTRKLDLGKLGVFQHFAGVKAGAVVAGEGSVSGDLNTPSSFNGSVRLDLSKILLDAQTLTINSQLGPMPLTLPRVEITEGTIELAIGQGRAQVKTLRLGRPGATPEDPLTGTVTGDVVLGKQWESSSLNLKTQFKLSEAMMKAFVLIDAVLGAGKQADGSYAFDLSGPLTQPTAAASKGGR